MTISVWNNKSNTVNTNYRIIFSIIIGLLFSFSSQIVIAQSSVNVPSTSASAAADQRGTTVINIDWKEYTFAGIARMETTKRKELQTKLDLTDPDIGEDLKSFLKNAANQLTETYKRWYEEAIEKIVKQIPQVVPLYEADIIKGVKIPITDKKSLEFAVKIWEPKEWIPRIKKILENPQNFADSAPR